MFFVRIHFCFWFVSSVPQIGIAAELQEAATFLTNKLPVSACRQNLAGSS